MDNKYKYLVKNTMLFTISSFGSKILVFLMIPLYTSCLSTTDYGIADIITTTATLLIYIITLNIADAVLRFSIDKSYNQEQYLKYGLQVLAVSSLMLAILLYILYSVDFIEWAGYYYIFLFLHFVILAFYQLLSNFLRAIDEVKSVAVSGIITTAVTICFNIVLLVLFDFGVIGYLISMISGTFISSVYCLVIIRNRIPMVIKCYCDKKTRKEMRNYSIPLIFNNVAWWMNTSIDKYFVTWICGASINGIYAASQKIPTIMSVFHSIFSQAWNLSAIKEFDKDDKDGFFCDTYILYNEILVLICSGLIIVNMYTLNSEYLQN